MTQPKYAPILSADEVRPTSHLAPPKPWSPHRPGEFAHGAALPGRGAGSPGPDQGYALRLARSFTARLVLADGEHADDALAGAVAIGLRRAALFGRAPVSADLEVALSLFGFLAAAEPELVALRRPLFCGASHDYWTERMLAQLVSEETLRLPVAQVHSDPSLWRGLAGSRT